MRFRSRLSCEELESRVVPTAVLAPYSPAQIQAAYGFPSGLTGAGQTIAIIDAYKDPSIVSDVNKFISKYSLPSINLQVVALGNQSNSGWALETALDVEWAHATAPGAKIVLVEAKSASFTDLNAAVTAAVTTYGATVVSMSYGSNEFAGETAYDSVFQAAASNGVTFVASSGDTSPVEYPAASPYVLSVGGTTLQINTNGNTETGWNNRYGTSGGGVSKYESIPLYQNNTQFFQDPLSSTNRTTPDVAYDADPATGFDVYSGGVLYQVGGTSDAAPQWAGIIALANQARLNVNPTAGTLSGYTQVLPTLYSIQSTGFTDITSGGRAQAGYDFTTGLGSPHVATIVSALASATSFSLSAPASTPATPHSPPSLPTKPHFLSVILFAGSSQSPTMSTAMVANTLQFATWTTPGLPIYQTTTIAQPTTANYLALDTSSSPFLPAGDSLSANNSGLVGQFLDVLRNVLDRITPQNNIRPAAGPNDSNTPPAPAPSPQGSDLDMMDEDTMLPSDAAVLATATVFDNKLLPAVLASVMLGINWHALTSTRRMSELLKAPPRDRRNE